jgi:hypothetical protein
MNNRQEQPSAEKSSAEKSSAVQSSTEQPRETDKPGAEQEAAPTQLSPEELRSKLISAKKGGRSAMLLKPPTEQARIAMINDIYNHLRKRIRQEDQVSATLKEWGVDDNFIVSIFYTAKRDKTFKTFWTYT